MPSKWITKERRQAIYMRDGLSCVYCRSNVHLTLDHLKPQSKGGKHYTKNLVTSCGRCNSSRGNRSARSFCIAVAAYLGVRWQEVVARVRRQSRRRIKKQRSAKSIA